MNRRGRGRGSRSIRAERSPRGRRNSHVRTIGTRGPALPAWVGRPFSARRNTRQYRSFSTVCVMEGSPIVQCDDLREARMARPARRTSKRSRQGPAQPVPRSGPSRAQSTPLHKDCASWSWRKENDRGFRSTAREEKAIGRRDRENAHRTIHAMIQRSCRSAARPRRFGAFRRQTRGVRRTLWQK